MSPPSSSRVTVLGSGFAALSSIREIRLRAPHVQITMLPLDNFLRRMSVTFLAAEVTGLQDGGRMVLTGNAWFDDTEELPCSPGCLVEADAHCRVSTRHFMLQPSRIFHGAKRAFEWNDLRQYR